MRQQAVLLVLLAVVVRHTPVLGSVIGVCIGGQTARLLPTLLLPLFTSNSKDEFRLFYSLQAGSNASDIKYWSDQSYVYEPSKYAALNKAELERALQVAFADLSNVQVSAVEIGVGHSAAEWSAKLLDGQPLSVIRLPKAVPEIVFNMYAHQTVCAAQIDSYTRDTSTAPLDYIFWAREDMHFYTGIDLVPLKAMLDPAEFGQADAQNSTTCHLLSRACLTHGGISLRGYLWKPEVALPVMHVRPTFYKHLHAQGRSVVTVEAFEEALMKHHKITVCRVAPDLLPTVAVRHVANGSFCIPPMEASKGCYPAQMHDYVQDKLCQKVGDSDLDYASRVRNIDSPHMLSSKGNHRGRGKGAGRGQAGTAQAAGAAETPGGPDNFEGQAALSSAGVPVGSAVPAVPAAAVTGIPGNDRDKDLLEKLKLSDLKVRSLEYKLKQMAMQQARQTSTEYAVLRKELVSTKKQVRDLDGGKTTLEAQLANLRSAYERLSVDNSQCRAQLAAASPGTATTPPATAASASAAHVPVPAQQPHEEGVTGQQTGDVREASKTDGKGKGMWGNWI